MSSLINLTFSSPLIVPHDALSGTTLATISGVSPALPTISISGAPSSFEGNSGTTSFNFTLTRSISTGAASVNYAITGTSGNPANAADFVGATLPTGTINFADSEASKPLAISVQGDGAIELDEQFTVTLSAPSSPYVLASSTAIGSILNDDYPPPSIALSAAVSHNEGNSGSTAFTYTLTLTRNNNTSALPYSWSVAGSGSNPADANDFTGGVLPSGSGTFATGETTKTITINVAGDLDIETDETFTLSATLTGFNTVSQTGSILNEDVTPQPLTTLPTANLLAYWDASDITGKSDGQTVATWTDRISGITATAPAGFEPTYKTGLANSKPALRFNGSKRMVINQVTALASAMTNSRNWSVSIFYKNAGNGSWNAIFGQGYDTGFLFQASSTDAAIAHVGCPYLNTTGTNVHTLSYSGVSGANTGRISLDGTAFSEPNAQQLNTSLPLGIGSTGNGGINSGDAADNSGYSGDILGFAIWSAGISPAKILQSHLYACRNWGEASPLAGLARFVVNDGDSQSAGPPGSGLWSYKLAQAKGWKLGSFAMVGRHSASVASGSGGGINGNNLVDWAAEEVDEFKIVTALPITLCWFEWYNQRTSDVPSVTSLDLPAIRAYNSARKAADPTIKILMGTALDSWADQADQSGRHAFSAGVVANSGGADVVVRLDLDSRIGVDGSAPSTVNGSNSYFGDGVHPNEAGEAAIASLFGPYLLADGSLAPAPSSAPVNSVAPVASGTGTIGQTLTATNGTWTNNPTSYAYQWQRSGNSITAATASSYTLVSADGSQSISCTVNATNAIGSTAATSNAISVAAPPAYTFTNSGLPQSDNAPASTITGMSLLTGTQSDALVVKGGKIHMANNVLAFNSGGVVRQPTGSTPYLEFAFDGVTTSTPYIICGGDYRNFVLITRLEAQVNNTSNDNYAISFEVVRDYDTTSLMGLRMVLAAGDTIRLYPSGTTVTVYRKASGASTFTQVPNGNSTPNPINFANASSYQAGKLGTGIGCGWRAVDGQNNNYFAEFDFMPFNIVDGS